MLRDHTDQSFFLCRSQRKIQGITLDGKRATSSQREGEKRLDEDKTFQMLSFFFLLVDVHSAPRRSTVHVPRQLQI